VKPSSLKAGDSAITAPQKSHTLGADKSIIIPVKRGIPKLNVKDSPEARGEGTRLILTGSYLGRIKLKRPAVIQMLRQYE
jgi:hypothetical protein